MSKVRAVIVMGLGPSGLFLVRQLHHWTDQIYGVGREDDVGLYSRYIRKERRYRATTKEEVMRVFSQIFQESGEKPLLYLSSDQYLTLLLELGDQIEAYVELAGSGLDTLRLINDKERTVRFCRENGIGIPDSYEFASFMEADAPHYPVIVKWNEKTLCAGKNPVGKVKVCRSKEEFQTLFAQVKEAGVDPAALHVQTYIEGDNGHQYSVGGYYQDGTPLAMVAVNQIKQYPQGISAMVLSRNNDITRELEKRSRSFAENLKFSGFLEMEYKEDANSHDIYLLDINPRPWGWVSALGSAYADFYKVLQGERPSDQPKPVVWKSPMRCLLSVRNKKNAAKPSDLSGYRRAFDIYDREDRTPGVMIYAMAFKKLLGRK